MEHPGTLKLVELSQFTAERLFHTFYPATVKSLFEMHMTQIGCWALVAGAVSVSAIGTGCGLAAEDDGLEVGTRTATVTTENGIWTNGIWTNGIWTNGIWTNGVWWDGGDWDSVTYGGQEYAKVAWYGLDQDGRDAAGWTARLNTEGDNDSRVAALVALTGIVKCALPEGESVQVQLTKNVSVNTPFGNWSFNQIQFHTLEGGIGLAPEFAAAPQITVGGQKTLGLFGGYQPVYSIQTGPACNTECQQSVSACFLSLLNPNHGIPVSLRGNQGPLRFSAAWAAYAANCDPNDPSPVGELGCPADLHHELNTFTWMEAAFWGNIFRPEPQVFVCEGDDMAFGLPVFQPEYIYDRVCGSGAVDCAVTHMGACADVGVCATDPDTSLGGAAFGWYDDCTDTLPGTLGATDATSYSTVITTYLDPSSLPQLEAPE